MRENRSYARLRDRPHVIVFIRVILQRRREKLGHLHGRKRRLARHPHTQHCPVTGVENHR